MAKSKKTKNKVKKTGKTKKTTKRRGRPPGSKNKKSEVIGISEDNDLLDLNKPSEYGRSLNSEDYDNLLIQQLKSKRKAKEKETFKEDYEPELMDDEEDIDDYDIEGYDIETAEGFEFEELGETIPRKTRKKKKKNYYDDFGIDSEYYESDYNIGEFQDYE
ncbi:MAG: hypothetical protein ACTSR3_13730 [Candidatus Helarchaeota archaeon]